MITRTLLLSLLSILILANCAQDDDDPVTPAEPTGLVPCELGNVRMGPDSICGCPPPGLLINGRCQTLRESEFYARNYDCPCPDTMFIQFTRDTNFNEFQNRPRSITTLISGGREADVPKSIVFSVNPPYGDTLYMHPVPEVDGGECLLDNGGRYLRTLRLFDFRYDADTVWGEIVLTQFGEIKDTCRMLLTR